MSYPEPCVGALILNKKDEIFLIKSPKWDSQYIIPGGHIEIGETMEEALKREIKEETNMEIEIIRLIDIFDGIFPDTYSQRKHLILIDFLCRRIGGEIQLQAEEAESYIWIDPKEAIKLPDILDTAKELIERYI